MATYTCGVKRAIFLDRDNTIIQNDSDLGNPGEVRLIRGAAHAIGSLRQLGYRIIVVSNQGGVARGKYTERDVDAVHERIAQMVHDSAGAIIDRFYYCPFHPDGTVAEYAKEHPWRKPQPGMLLEAARSLDLELRECWMIGDHERDIDAGRAAGCQTILITRKTSVNTRADFQAASLAEAAAIIAQNRVRIRQVLPSTPIPTSTVVVSPRVVQETKATTDTTAAPIARLATPVQEQPHRVRDEPAPALVPRRGAAVVEQHEEQGHGIADDEPADDAPHAQAPTEVEADHESDEKEQGEADAPAPLRRDPFRHIPVRVHGLVRERPERDAEAANTDRLLTEMLSEIRSWRHSQREFTPPMMLGSLASIALLIVAVLLGVYLEPATATPWIFVTLVAQLSVSVFIILNLRR